MNSNEKSFITFASGGLHVAMRTLTKATTAVCRIIQVSALAPAINWFEACLFFIICVGINEYTQAKTHTNTHTHTKTHTHM